MFQVIAKGPYFNEMSELYGYRPNVEPKATSSSNGIDTTRAAPAASETLPKCNEKKKKKYVTSAEASSNTLSTWLKSQDEKWEQRERERLSLVREMHDEKMSVFKDLLDTLRN